MSSGNKATVTKDSIFTLCHYCILLIGSHWHVTILPPKPSHCHLTNIVPPCLIHFAYPSSPAPSNTSLFTQLRPSSTRPPNLPSQVFWPSSCVIRCVQLSQLCLKSASINDMNPDVSNHQRNDNISTSALTRHLWLLLDVPLGETLPTNSSQLDSTANGRLNVKLVLRMSIALSLHLPDTFFLPEDR